MTTHVLSNHSSSTLRPSSQAHRPAVDLLVERAAKSMLAWSDRRAEKNLVSHERMALLRANAAEIGGSSVAR